MNKLGIQWQIESKAVEEYNLLVQPRALMGINSYNLEFWQRLQADNPQALRIFRFYPNFDEYLGIGLDQPELLAVESANLLKREIGHLAAAGAITHVLGMNEWVHSFEHDKHPKADRFMAAFIPMVWQELGLPAIVLNAACGHYAEETADLFPLTLQELATRTELPPQKKPYIAFHEYDYPTMIRLHEEDLAKGGQGYWLCGKWKRIMPKIRERYGNIQCIITECGIDGGVVGLHGRGFRSTAPDLDSAVRQYCGDRSLRWIKRLADEDDSVYALIIFGLSMGGDWGDFDINGTDVPKFIVQMPNWEPKPPEPELPEPEPPKPEESTMDLTNVRVFKLKPDYSGHVECKTLADKEALVSGKYGAAFRRTQVAAGQKVYRLVELWEKTGHSSLVTQVLNEDGQPMANVDVAFYWPDAPQEPGAYAHDWHRNFIHGKTNKNGDLGPGMGPGAYHGEGEGGPHAVWVRDPNIPSDICEKLGMLAGTNHDHLDQKFQLVVEGGEEPLPPPPPPPTGELTEVDRIVKTGQAAHELCILFPESLAYDTRGKAGITGSGIDLPTSEPFEQEHGGRKWAAFSVCCNFTDPGDRQYWIGAWHLVKGKLVTPAAKATFSPFQEGQGKHEWVVYDYGEPPGPGPQPPPEPGPQPPNVQAFAESLSALGTSLSEAWAEFAAQMKKIG